MAEGSVQEMRETQGRIMRGLELLDHLHIDYKHKQERTFINTFLHVMDRMSNELLAAYEHIEHIDREILADPSCTMLTKELNFFKLQSVELARELDQVNLQLRREKERSRQLQDCNRSKASALLHKAKVISKYRSISVGRTTNGTPRDSPRVPNHSHRVELGNQNKLFEFSPGKMETPVVVRTRTVERRRAGRLSELGSWK